MVRVPGDELVEVAGARWPTRRPSEHDVTRFAPVSSPRGSDPGPPSVRVVPLAKAGHAIVLPAPSRPEPPRMPAPSARPSSSPAIHHHPAPGVAITPMPYAAPFMPPPPPSSLRPWSMTDAPYAAPAPARPAPRLPLSAIALTTMAFFVAMVCMGGFLFLQSDAPARTAQASAPPPAAETVAATTPAPTPLRVAPAQAVATAGATANVAPAPIAAKPKAASPSRPVVAAAGAAIPKKSAPPAARPVTAAPVAEARPTPKPKRADKTVEELLAELGEEQLRR